MQSMIDIRRPTLKIRVWLRNKTQDYIMLNPVIQQTVLARDPLYAGWYTKLDP